MSTINTSVSRAVTGRGRTERRRAPGTLTTLAEADQRNQGPFGFPTLQQRLERRLPNRFGGPSEPSAIPGQAAPTTATPGQVQSTIAGVEGSGGIPLSDLTREQLENFTPEQLVVVDESTRQANAINTILGMAAEPFREFDFFGGELGGDLESSLRNRLNDPEAISDEARNAAISAGTETILGRERANAQNLQENLAARGISDSGLSFALAQAGGEASARGIAGIRRDAFLQQELARSAREAEIQRLAASVVGAKGGLDLQAAAGESRILEQNAFSTIGFEDVNIKKELDDALTDASDEDADRRFQDFLSTGLGGFLALLSGQLVRAGNPGAAAILGLLGAAAAGRISNQGA